MKLTRKQEEMLIEIGIASLAQGMTENTERVAQAKKLHWTQTPAGKAILAKRGKKALKTDKGK